MDNRSEVVQEFVSSLRDLWCNSKPLIKILTQLAKEGLDYAEEIFVAVKIRLSEVPINVKLPVLYLLDSIIKNVGKAYTALFCQDVVSILRPVYLQMSQETRKQVLKVRQTWNCLIPPNKLYLLDINIAHVDPARPVATYSSRNYFNSITAVQPSMLLMPKQPAASLDPTVHSLQQRIMAIQKKLLEIQQRKLELNYMEAQIKLQQERVRHNSNMVCLTYIPNISLLQTSYVKNADPKKNSADTPIAIVRPIRDPRLLCRQQRQQNVSLKSEPKNSPCYDCATKIVTKTDLLESNQSTKRLSSENIELPVYKKAKLEIRKGSSVSEVTLARLHTDTSLQQISETAAFNIKDKTPKRGSPLREVFINSVQCAAQKENKPTKVYELFKQLTAKSINNPFNKPEKPTPSPSFSNLKPDLFDSHTLKIRQSSVLQSLHQGKQCGSCGMRFSAEQSTQYREHLDWHFRQNRRLKEKKVFRRSWYCFSSDWTTYHDDLEGKEKNYFEKQKEAEEHAKKSEDVKIPCIRADTNAHRTQCEVCQDAFEQFYNEEEDEWQLRMAIRVEGKIYHPVCYQDYQASLN